MKNIEVCKGCEYLSAPKGSAELRNSCSYCLKTGKSRLAIELKLGGYDENSCPCFKQKQKGRPKKNKCVLPDANRWWGDENESKRVSSAGRKNR